MSKDQEEELPAEDFNTFLAELEGLDEQEMMEQMRKEWVILLYARVKARLASPTEMGLLYKVFRDAGWDLSKDKDGVTDLPIPDGLPSPDELPPLELHKAM